MPPKLSYEEGQPSASQRTNQPFLVRRGKVDKQPAPPLLVLVTMDDNDDLNQEDSGEEEGDEENDDMDDDGAKDDEGAEDEDENERNVEGNQEAPAVSLL